MSNTATAPVPVTPAEQAAQSARVTRLIALEALSKSRLCTLLREEERRAGYSVSHSTPPEKWSRHELAQHIDEYRQRVSA